MSDDGENAAAALGALDAPADTNVNPPPPEVLGTAAAAEVAAPNLIGVGADDELTPKLNPPLPIVPAVLGNPKKGAVANDDNDDDGGCAD